MRLNTACACARLSPQQAERRSLSQPPELKVTCVPYRNLEVARRKDILNGIVSNSQFCAIPTSVQSSGCTAFPCSLQVAPPSRAVFRLHRLLCSLQVAPPSHALSVRRCAPTFSGFMSETLISLTLPTLHCNPPKAATVQDSLTFVSVDARIQILLQTSSASDF